MNFFVPVPVNQRRLGMDVALMAPSVRLVYPEDAMRLSESCGACVCLMVLKGCSYCEAFWPTWSDFCGTVMSGGQAAVVHCEASQLRERVALVCGGPRTFPTVVVCSRGGGVRVLEAIDSRSSVADLKRHALAALAGSLAAEATTTFPSEGVDPAPVMAGGESDGENNEAHEDEEHTPLEDLAMHEEEDNEEGDKEEEKEDEKGCGCGSAGDHHHVTTADGVAVTHDMAPAEVQAKAETADAEHRVCIFYFTNWCGHCTAMKPIWNASVAEQDGSHAWCAINCETPEGEAAARAAGVRGYPTLHLHHRFREPFEGERTTEALLAFVNRETPRPSLLDWAAPSRSTSSTSMYQHDLIRQKARRAVFENKGPENSTIVDEIQNQIEIAGSSEEDVFESIREKIRKAKPLRHQSGGLFAAEDLPMHQEHIQGLEAKKYINPYATQKFKDALAKAQTTREQQDLLRKEHERPSTERSTPPLVTRIPPPNGIQSYIHTN